MLIKPKTWFPKFITALNKSGYDHLAEIIDPKLKNVISEDGARNITDDMKQLNIAPESSNTTRSSHFSMDGQMHKITQLHGQDAGAALSILNNLETSSIPTLANKDLPIPTTRGKCMDQTKQIAEVKPLGHEKVLNSSLSDSCPSDEDNEEPKSVSETFAPKDNESKRILIQQDSGHSHLQETEQGKMQDVHMNQLGCETNKSWNIPFSASVATPKTPTTSPSSVSSSTALATSRVIFATHGNLSGAGPKVPSHASSDEIQARQQLNVKELSKQLDELQLDESEPGCPSGNRHNDAYPIPTHSLAPRTHYYSTGEPQVLPSDPIKTSMVPRRQLEADELEAQGSNPALTEPYRETEETEETSSVGFSYEGGYDGPNDLLAFESSPSSTTGAMQFKLYKHK